MENRKHVIGIACVLIYGLLIHYAHAYSTDTHEYLTKIAVDTFNASDTRISTSLEKYLLDGSRREDDPPRWMNHFYDPIHNRGLTYDTTIDPLINLGNWPSAKEWAQNENLQTQTIYHPIIATILSSLESGKLQEYTGTANFTWKKAQKEWIQGNKEEALFALGHILHLIEDMTVPDHTRNDPHPGDSPYENYTQQFTLYNPDISLKKNEIQELPIRDLLKAIETTASYSNKNFYSKDTIGIQSGYEAPQIERTPKEKGTLYGINLIDGSEIKTLIYKRENGSLLNPLNKGVSLYSEGNNEVLKDYWKLLSKKAVSSAVGVLNLFFQEVEKNKNNPEYTKKESKSFLGDVLNAVTSVWNLKENVKERTRIELADLEENTTSTADPEDNQLSTPKKSAQEELPACSKITRPSLSKDIIFSEIAWMGTTEGSSNEWIELVNISGKPLSLTGWSIRNEEESVHMDLSAIGALKAGGYALLERTDDDAVPTVSADALYAGGLRNTGDQLYLLDATCRLHDSIEEEKWAAGNTEERKTMERDFATLTWHTSLSPDGTPKKPNSKAPVITPKASPIPSTSPTPKPSTPPTPKPSPTPTSHSSGGGGSGGVVVQRPSPSSFSLEITEIMYDPTGTDSGHEWIEIKNTKNAATDISELRLTESGTNHLLTAHRGSLTIPAGGLAVICDNCATFVTDFPSSTATLIESSFSLANAGENIAVTLDGTNITQIEYEDSWGGQGNGTSLQKINATWVENVPSPGVENTPPQQSPSPSPSPSASPSPSPSSTPVIVLHITEIMYNPNGNDTDREWIEIKNLSPDPLDPTLLTFSEGGTNHRIEYIQGNTLLTSSTYGIIATKPERFLQEFPSYTGPLYKSAFSLSNEGEALKILLENTEKESVSYESGLGGDGDGRSLQRSQEQWCEGDPTPGQETQCASALRSVHTLQATYVKDTLSIDLSWEADRPVGSYFEIYDTSGTDDVLLVTTTQQMASVRIKEVGRKYLLSVIGKDGARAYGATEKEIAVPGFLSDVDFFDSSAPKITLKYSSYPFMPPEGDWNKYGLVFYLNHEPFTEESFEETTLMRYWSEDAQWYLARAVYGQCRGPTRAYPALLITDEISACSDNIPLEVMQGTTSYTAPIELSKVPTSNDYLTVAYYSKNPYIVTPQTYYLKAIDKTRYYFSEE